MAKEKFLLVSLNETKSKKLAQAISNESCRKILDYLADHEATESELAEKLDIPISTVHYNLKQLQKGGLVAADEFHYSEKGKEINHYKLANKYIIIAPKSTYGIKEKLKSVLPVALIAAVGAGFIQLFRENMFSSVEMTSGVRMLEEAAMEAAPAVDAVAGTSAVAADAAPKAAEMVAQTSVFSNIALWFFIGAVVALLIYLLIDWIRNRKSS